MFRLVLFLCVAAVAGSIPLLTTPVWAGWEEGRSAYMRADYATALHEFRLLASKGDSKAQVQLGFMYENGWGLPQNDVEAVKWYRNAVAQGDAGGQFKLGRMYERGKGVPENKAEAAKWYRLAAKQGILRAQVNLGRMYSKGQGVPHSDAVAAKWYRKAASGRLHAPPHFIARHLSFAPRMIESRLEHGEDMVGGGGTVVWVKMTMAESGPNSFPVYYKYFFQEEGRKKHLAALTEGAELHRIYPKLDVKPDEPVVLKNRFSALIQGSSDLDGLCKAHGIDTLIVVGTLTNVCCESTVRDAMMLGYRALMPADANATLSDEEHLAGLITVAQFFGDIRDTNVVIRLIKQGTGGATSQAAE